MLFMFIKFRLEIVNKYKNTIIFNNYTDKSQWFQLELQYIVSLLIKVCKTNSFDMV